MNTSTSADNDPSAQSNTAINIAEIEVTQSWAVLSVHLNEEENTITGRKSRTCSSTAQIEALIPLLLVNSIHVQKNAVGSWF